jgi:ribosomal protein S18 acetylase RimI-like enzyme
MNIDCEIRPFLHKDLISIKNISNVCFSEPQWDDLDFERFIEKMNKPTKQLKHSAYVAEWREHVVGYVFVSEYPTYFEVVSIGVHPDFQKKGVGRKLLEFVKWNKLEPYGREEVFMYIKEDEKEAITFAKKAGFYKVDKVKGHYEDDSSALKFVFVLPEIPIDLMKIPIREGGLLVCDGDC